MHVRAAMSASKACHDAHAAAKNQAEHDRAEHNFACWMIQNFHLSPQRMAEYIAVRDRLGQVLWGDSGT